MIAEFTKGVTVRRGNPGKFETMAHALSVSQSSAYLNVFS